MSDGSITLRDIADGWLNATLGQSSGQESGDRVPLSEPDSARLFSLSIEIRTLLDARVPDPDVLEKTGVLFDEVSTLRWGLDIFGERYELCQQLSFVAWRHAYGLGLLAESQEWFRTAELVAIEDSTASDCLKSFLFLPKREKTPSLWRTALASSVDVFGAICVLRQNRFVHTLQVSAIAAEAYEWVSENLPGDSSSSECDLFLGELAFVAALCLRQIGKRSAARRWQKKSHSHFRRCLARRPVRLKLLCERLLLDREAHNHRQVLRFGSSLVEPLRSCGMYREAQLCRVALAFSDRMLGRNEDALAACEGIFSELANGSEHGVLSRLSGNIGELRAQLGDVTGAREALKVCLEEAEMANDGPSRANACLYVGSALHELGDLDRAARAYREAVHHSLECGFEYWGAYSRIVLAETLISLRRPNEALGELLLAVPFIRREEMIPEGIHALKLLGQILNESPLPGDVNRELASRLQASLRQP